MSAKLILQISVLLLDIVAITVNDSSKLMRFLISVLAVLLAVAVGFSLQGAAG